MSFEEVKTKWMEIGTTSKEEMQDANEDNRVVNGEKGIGRFGADKLGAVLKLISLGLLEGALAMKFLQFRFEVLYCLRIIPVANSTHIYQI